MLLEIKQRNIIDLEAKTSDAFEALDNAIAFYRAGNLRALSYDDRLACKSKSREPTAQAKSLYEEALRDISGFADGANPIGWGRETPHGRLFDRFIVQSIVGGTAAHLLQYSLENDVLKPKQDYSLSFGDVRQVIDDKTGVRHYMTKIMPVAIRLASTERFDLVVQALRYVRENYPMPFIGQDTQASEELGVTTRVVPSMVDYREPADTQVTTSNRFSRLVEIKKRLRIPPKR
ncbi:MAG: hypothetical protein Q8R04_02150 [Nanoarchaeota archaeon]|nr:hypothetical protein [Nanoarchaeota archaeon]